jgi:hypothetical protein
MKHVLALTALLAATAAAAHPSEHHRDPAVPYHFQQLHPCPSTGRTTGACPGYVRDHINPLCKGGVDSANNMQWQTTADAKTKDKTECR